MSGFKQPNTITDAERKETSTLIAASKVSGTAVYSGSGESLGSIYDVMIDKRSGRVSYAVLSFGGFLGMGQAYHPLPWDKLIYDEGLGGYVINLEKNFLEGAPAYESAETARWDEPDYTAAIDRYYTPGVPVL